MQASNGENRYVEDGFELEDSKRKAFGLKRRNALLRKYRKEIKTILAVSAVLLLLVAYFSIKEFIYRAEMEKSEVINELVREVVAEPPPPAEKMEVTVQPVKAVPVAVEPPEEAPENRVVLEKIVKLRESFSNDDIVSYLKIDGTNVDYAVAQFSDNDYYLNRDLYGEKNVAGSIFMDYECDMEEISKNTVIYGHNMKDGSMFHNLRYYADPEYYKEHRYISLTTPYEETKWEIFSFYKTTPDFYYIQVLFPNENAFAALAFEMKKRSMYDTGVDVTAKDKILTLSTCANTADDARLVVNAKLIGENQ